MGKLIWAASEIVTFQLKMIAVAKSHKKKHKETQKKEMKDKQSQTELGRGCPTGQRPKAC